MFVRTLVPVIVAIMLNDVAFTHEPALDFRIKLCLNEVKPKIKELIHDFVVWQLIMQPDVEVVECANQAANVYVFRQEVIEIREHAHKRYQIIIALYDKKHLPILSRIELVDRLNRQVMIERAINLVPLMKKSIESHHVVKDPFIPSEEKRSCVPHAAEEVPDTAEIVMNKPHVNYELEFFLGMERSAQSLGRNFLSEGTQEVITRSYPMMGGGLVVRSFYPVILTTSVRGAMVPVDLLRPLMVKPYSNTIKMFDWYIEPSFNIIKNTGFNLDLGCVFSLYYFHLGLLREISDSFRSHLWHLKEGVSARIYWTFPSFLTSLGVYATFFPLVHNFAPSSVDYDANLAWQVGIYGESVLYRALALKLSFYHRGEYLFNESSPNPSIVSHGTLAYLSLVFRI